MERMGDHFQTTADEARQSRILSESRFNFTLFTFGMLVVAGCFFFMISATSL
jgi:hypothetical protein